MLAITSERKKALAVADSATEHSLDVVALEALSLELGLTARESTTRSKSPHKPRAGSAVPYNNVGSTTESFSAQVIARTRY